MVLTEQAETIDMGIQIDAPSPPNPHPWFPAKTYGWGWGRPSMQEVCRVLVDYGELAQPGVQVANAIAKGKAPTPARGILTTRMLFMVLS
jgi:hypothetical protein